MVAGYFAYTAVVGFYQNHQIAEQRDRAEERVQALERKQAYLEAVYDYVSSDDYVEQQARRELGYARPGEVPFIVVGPEPEDESVVADDWWQRLFPR
ncbi:MAG: septum formation initiator family protein [Dehalococcoidia bacterium]|nr:septum formation initiator family protein [Dehalococcoidia bacterium]